jgi:hypothetical protein
MVFELTISKWSTKIGQQGAKLQAMIIKHGSYLHR